VRRIYRWVEGAEGTAGASGLVTNEAVFRRAPELDVLLLDELL
jgi:hypothetical protein